MAGHYKGKCYAWDVVNEALEEDGSWRESVFYQVLGEEYIKLAFRLAAEVDPEAKLYYNDYNIERPGDKVDGALRIVKMLQDDGIRIDGVGMQAHFTIGRSPSLDDQIAVIESYGALNVEVAYTELDVRVDIPSNSTGHALQKKEYRNVSLTFQLPLIIIFCLRGKCHNQHLDKISANTVTFLSPGRGCLCPDRSMHRHHPLGLLRPLQLGSVLLSGLRRAAAVV